ncbi:MAG: NUDIX domain-containing protein [bacterium]
MNDEQRVKVGIGVMVMRDGRVLMHKRMGAHGENTYAWPGGHMEYMESFEDCAKRETMEEAGIEIANVRFLRLMNLKTYAPKHYVDIGLVADWKSGEPKLVEPDKGEGWSWYDLDDLPEPLFSTIPSYIEAYRNGRYFYDD